MRTFTFLVAAVLLASCKAEQHPTLNPDAVVLSKVVLKNVTTGENPDLPVLAPYPAALKYLPQLELGTAVLHFMPPAESELIDWSFNADGPVAWETVGYTSDIHGDTSTRKGLLRVHVLGTFATVLRQVKNELAWEVRYTTTESAKWGPQSIELAPGVDDEGGCFGTLYSGCSFDPRASLTQAGIAHSVVCSSSNEGNGTSVFTLSYPGRAPMLLAWSTSTGSGGKSSFLTMRLYRGTEPVKCA